MSDSVELSGCLPPFYALAQNLDQRYSLGIFCIHGILSLIFAMGVRAVWPDDLTISFLPLLPLKVVGWLILLGVSLAGSWVMARVGLGKMVR